MDPFSGQSPRPSRRTSAAKKRLWLISVFALLVVAVLLFFALTGGGGGTAAERGDAGGTGENPATTEGFDSGEQASNSDEGPSGEQSMPVPDKAQDPDVASNPPARSHDGGEDFVTLPEGSAPTQQNASPTQTGGGEGYDPLGTGADPSEKTDSEKQRIRSAASRYVTYAYGYTGEDVRAYRDKLSSAVISRTFDSSPASAEIREIEQTIEADGLRSAALLTNFELNEQNLHEVTATIEFETGEGYGDGAVTGQTTTYSQELNLQLEGSSWKVAKAQTREEIDE